MQIFALQSAGIFRLRHRHRRFEARPRRREPAVVASPAHHPPFLHCRWLRRPPGPRGQAREPRAPSRLPGHPGSPRSPRTGAARSRRCWTRPRRPTSACSDGRRLRRPRGRWRRGAPTPTPPDAAGRRRRRSRENLVLMTASSEIPALVMPRVNRATTSSKPADLATRRGMKRSCGAHHERSISSHG